MSGLRRIASLPAGIALAVALGSCGAQDSAAKNDYVKQVNAAQTQFASAATTAQQEITQTSSARQDRRALGQFVRTIDTLTGRLRSIEVPGEARGDHDRLVAAIDVHGKEVSQLIARMRSSTTAVLADVHRRLSAAGITVNHNLAAATAAINVKLRAK